MCSPPQTRARADAPARCRYKGEDSYSSLLRQIQRGEDRTEEMIYSMPVGKEGVYNQRCENIPHHLVKSRDGVHDPASALHRNIHVFVRLDDKTMVRNGIRKTRSVYLQLGRFEYVAATTDMKRVRLRPIAGHPTQAAPAPSTPVDAAVVASLAGLHPPAGGQ